MSKETLIKQLHRFRMIALAEGGDPLDRTNLVGKGHHRPIAVDGVAGAGKIPLSALAGRRFGLGEMRRDLGVRRTKELNLRYGK